MLHASPYQVLASKHQRNKAETKHRTDSTSPRTTDSVHTYHSREYIVQGVQLTDLNCFQKSNPGGLLSRYYLKEVFMIVQELSSMSMVP